MSTGVHLHWECWVGKTHGWTDNGKGFLEPIEFTKAQIKKARILATKDETTPDDVTADVEDAAPAAPETAPEAPKAAAPAPAAPAAPKAATAAPAARIPGYTVKSGDSYWKIAEKFAGKHGGGRGVSDYTRHLQALNKNKALKPGDKVRLA
jgi:nucleoid-associated protein YgaU